MIIVIVRDRIVLRIRWCKIEIGLKLHMGYRLNTSFAREIIFARIKNHPKFYRQIVNPSETRRLTFYPFGA